MLKCRGENHAAETHTKRKRRKLPESSRWPHQAPPVASATEGTPGSLTLTALRVSPEATCWRGHPMPFARQALLEELSKQAPLTPQNSDRAPGEGGRQPHSTHRTRRPRPCTCQVRVTHRDPSPRSPPTGPSPETHVSDPPCARGHTPRGYHAPAATG